MHVRLSDLMFTTYGYRYHKIAQESFAAQGAADRFSGPCDPILTVFLFKGRRHKTSSGTFLPKMEASYILALPFVLP